MVNKILDWLLLKKKPVLIARKDHCISRSNISKNALKVLYRLHNNGYQAYLVGGGVRDLLLGTVPKDFDVATNAHPEEIKKLFTNCRLIGRRFRLAHVHFGQDIIEVATFRGLQKEAASQSDEGMILHDNAYGTLSEDVLRRDFTINSLYYNIADFSIVDYVKGLRDIQKKLISIIGTPTVRYREDPVRMLRAIRFAAKLQFTIKKDTEKPIKDLGYLLANIAPARLFEEYLKLFCAGHAYPAYQLLIKHGLFKFLFPTVSDNKLALFRLALINTDDRVKQNKPIAPAFLLAIFLWPMVFMKTKEYMSQKIPEFPSLHMAMEEVLSVQQKAISIPRRFINMIKEIWELQLRLKKQNKVIIKKNKVQALNVWFLFYHVIISSFETI